MLLSLPLYSLLTPLRYLRRAMPPLLRRGGMAEQRKKERMLLPRAAASLFS